MNRFVTVIFYSLFCIYFYCTNTEVAYSRDKTVSPISYGLFKAKTGEERYEVLLKTHQDALIKGIKVDYSKIDTIDISIPVNGQSIPLGITNDFSGVVFRVTNHTKDFFLFSYQNVATEISVSSYAVDKRSFGDYSSLNNGKKLLIVEDKNPWVNNRTGYSYGHVRKDILLLENGRAQNKTIMPYDNSNSSVSCKYYDIDRIPYIQLSNLSLVRTADCTYKTFLCNILGVNDVVIKNVSIMTPPNDMVSDLVFYINDCTNVSFEDVTINGTYSRTDYSGYGICMDNIWNFKAKNLNCNANWGIFGNNNINTAALQNCDINRFDVHCYGKDITFTNCTFRAFYNQFSSIYGKIEFYNCKFIDFTPVLFEPSYNAYVKFNLRFKDCEVYSSNNHNHLIYAVGLNGESTTERKELSRQEYPNLYIDGLKIVGGEPYYIYLFEKKAIQWPNDDVPGIKRIKNVSFVANDRQTLYNSNQQLSIIEQGKDFLKRLFSRLIQ